jgi:hypothetical protein
VTIAIIVAIVGAAAFTSLRVGGPITVIVYSVTSLRCTSPSARLAVITVRLIFAGVTRGGRAQALRAPCHSVAVSIGVRVKLTATGCISLIHERVTIVIDPIA